jgi:hypothetical protein
MQRTLKWGKGTGSTTDQSIVTGTLWLLSRKYIKIIISIAVEMVISITNLAFATRCT